MTDQTGRYEKVLSASAAHALHWLDAVRERPVGPRVSADALLEGFGGPIPELAIPPEEVVDELARLAEPGLMASQSGRFFGWVMGGTLPAALGADWLVSAWDQNAGLRYATPAVAAAEEAAASWLLDLLDLPPSAGVGFATGATMASFTCLASARTSVLENVGWDVARDGLTGAPRVRVLVGAERHDTIDLALRYLGLGAPQVVASDDEGRILVAALGEALSEIDRDLPTIALGEALSEIDRDLPTILCLQAGNLHSGAFDPFAECIEQAHRQGAWVHVDGAFGLWAAASPLLRHLTSGLRDADSWATDAHKTLNVPYDCGIAIVADPTVLRTAMGLHTSYLVSDNSGPGDPFERVPELSRRARGVPVWAALRSLGRAGVAGLVEGLVHNAAALAEGLSTIKEAEILNDVVYTQVCVALGDADRTRAVTARLIADGTAWMSGSRWHDREVMRISVSNWVTDEEDVRRSIDAVRRAVATTA